MESILFDLINQAVSNLIWSLAREQPRSFWHFMMEWWSGPGGLFQGLVPVVWNLPFRWILSMISWCWLSSKHGIQSLFRLSTMHGTAIATNYAKANASAFRGEWNAMRILVSFLYDRATFEK